MHAIPRRNSPCGWVTIQLTLIAVIGLFFYRDGAARVQALRSALNRVANKLASDLLEIVGGTINRAVYGHRRRRLGAGAGGDDRILHRRCAPLVSSGFFSGR